MGIDSFLDVSGLDSSRFQPEYPIAGVSGGGGGNALSSFAGLGALAGPGGAAIGAAAGLVGTGITEWLRYKREREMEEEAKRRYEQQMKIQQEQFEKEYKMALENQKMDKATLLSNMRQQALQNKNYLEERNASRVQNYTDRLIKLINQPTVSKFMQAYGR